MIYYSFDCEYFPGFELSEPEDSVRMMIKAIHEGNLKTVENILEENAHVLMAELNMEKLSFLPAGKIITALKSGYIL